MNPGRAPREQEVCGVLDYEKRNGTLRVRADKVAAALGNRLPATIAGLLEGGSR